MVLGIFPEWCSTRCPLRKNEREDPTENPPPPHSVRPGTGNWLECWLASHQTSDHSSAGLLFPSGGLQYNWAEGGNWQGHATTEYFYKNYYKIDKRPFFMTCLKLERFGRRFGKKRYLFSGKFIGILMSKLVRSTLTSPGTIRVKIVLTFHPILCIKITDISIRT